MKKMMGWLKGQWIFRITKIQVWRLKGRDGGTKCYYCYCPFTETGNRQRTVDHRVARSRGGSRLRLSNMVFACAACNRQKAATPEVAFITSPWLASRKVTLAHEAGYQRRPSVLH